MTISSIILSLQLLECNPKRLILGRRYRFEKWTLAVNYQVDNPFHINWNIGQSFSASVVDDLFYLFNRRGVFSFESEKTTNCKVGMIDCLAFTHYIRNLLTVA